MVANSETVGIAPPKVIGVRIASGIGVDSSVAYLQNLTVGAVVT